jgi:hypothetical protein
VVVARLLEVGVLGDQLVHPADQAQLEIRRRWRIALGRSVLADELARPPLRHRMPSQEVPDGVPAARRAYKFPFCRSLSIEMSKAWSATIRFKRAFSDSSAFSRCASSSFSAPYRVRYR